MAIIGAGADHYFAGGGSAFVRPTSLVSILEGIRRRAGKGVRVKYAQGTDPVSPADLLPGPAVVPSSVLTPTDSDAGLHGLHAQYWTNTRFEGAPGLVRTDGQAALNLGFFNFFDQSELGLPATPHDLNNAMSVRWTGYLNVPLGGDYIFSLTHLGAARLLIDGQLLIDDPGIALETQSVALPLTASQSYTLQIEYAADRPNNAHQSRVPVLF